MNLVRSKQWKRGQFYWFPGDYYYDAGQRVRLVRVVKTSGRGINFKPTQYHFVRDDGKKVVLYDNDHLLDQKPEFVNAR